ncbi:2,3-bisphosphoglycerate-independent phosphoglycerate mutase [Candidatus Falkowbacteria bacterium]|nr:2,3-bisphosphoglycerate-independent phosphoglycerate mutase [Candidatus Falkowbacteria bacterium]
MSEIKLKYPVTVLVVIDGWGIAPPSVGNAIAKSKTPHLNELMSRYPTSTLVSYGDAVGLRWGEMGNSEVGHLSIGAGMVFYQNLPRINKEIARGEFYNNEVLMEAASHVKKNKSAFHVVGLVSTGGVHSHIDHLFAVLDFCSQQEISKVYLHAILDGRDVTYNSGKVFLQDVFDRAKELKVDLELATVAGRFYAMDRDNRMDRTSDTYDAMVHGKGAQVEGDIIEYIDSLYAKEIFDEQVPPVVITKKGKPVATVKDGDAVVFYNFRSDRDRQLTKAFVIPHFTGITNQVLMPDLFFATMVEYEKDLPVHVMYPPLIIKQPLAKVIADAGLSQFHIAETEKYAHVTFFLNGGIETPFDKEERKVIPSPKVSSYDQAPEMKAKEITDEVLSVLSKGSHEFVVVNFANPDMVAHTGNLEATIKACEVVDKQIGRLAEAVLSKQGLLVITADHGNAEELLNLQTNQIDKEHSTNPVPFIIVSKDMEGKNVGLPEGVGGDLSTTPPAGILADVAPTILTLMGIDIPPEMTGSSLV